MPKYFKESTGVVHVMDLRACGEFTLCGYAWDATSEDSPILSDEPMEEVPRGPVTCPYCKRAADEIRQSLKGVRWNIKQ